MTASDGTRPYPLTIRQPAGGYGRPIVHSAAIFFGFLLFCWGASSLRMALLIIRDPTGGNAPLESPFDRWMMRLVAALMVPLPAALTVGGSAMVRWGVFGG